MTFNITTFSIMTFNKMDLTVTLSNKDTHPNVSVMFSYIVMLNVIMLSVVIVSVVVPIRQPNIFLLSCKNKK
jgi:hypothetical protein